jgi:hypothetical protein
MSPRPRERAAVVRGPAEGDALLRARRKFSLAARSYARCTITYIVMSVLGAGCLITLVCLVMANSKHPWWPWIAGAAVAGVLGLHAFAKQGRLEDCPHCKASLRGYAGHCPGCGATLVEGAPSCPACRLSFADPPKLAMVHWCSTCGTELVAPAGAPRERAVSK